MPLTKTNPDFSLDIRLGCGIIVEMERPILKQGRRNMVSINLMNQKGDQAIATYDPAVAESVQVAQDKLTAFLGECVTKYGSEPPVWGRRCGEVEYDRIKPDEIAGILPQVDDMILQYPMAGG